MFFSNMDPCAVCVCMCACLKYIAVVCSFRTLQNRLDICQTVFENIFMYIYIRMYSRYMCITMCEMPSTPIQHAFCIYVCLRFLSRFTTCTYSPHAPSLRHNRNESVWYNSMRVNKSVCIVYVCKQEVIYVQCSITFGYAKYIQTQCYVLYTLFLTGIKKLKKRQFLGILCKIGWIVHVSPKK